MYWLKTLVEASTRTNWDSGSKPRWLLSGVECLNWGYMTDKEMEATRVVLSCLPGLNSSWLRVALIEMFKGKAILWGKGAFKEKAIFGGKAIFKENRTPYLKDKIKEWEWYKAGELWREKKNLTDSWSLVRLLCEEWAGSKEKQRASSM